MAAPKSPAPAEQPPYKPAVYEDDEKVDSKKGQPWHLARHDAELWEGINAKEGVFPMTKADFDKKAAPNKEEKAPETQN